MPFKTTQKINPTCYLVAATFFGLCTGESFAQTKSVNSFSISLIDSSEYEFSSGCTGIVTGGTLDSYLSMWSEGLATNKMGKETFVKLDQQAIRKEGIKRPSFRFVTVSSDSYFLYEYWWKKLLVFSREGGLTHSYPVISRLNGVTFDTFILGVNDGVLLKGKDLVLFLPVLPLEYDSVKLAGKLGAPPGSVGLYHFDNGKLRLTKLLAPFRGIYGDTLWHANHLGNVSLSGSRSEDKVYINPIADPIVRVYSLQGELLGEVGVPGRYAYNQVRRIPEYFFGDTLQNIKLSRACTLYRNWTEDQNGNFAYRIYLPGLNVSEAERKKSQEDNTPIPRAAYLQVYDLTQNESPLIADIPLPLLNVREIISATDGALIIRANSRTSPAMTKLYQLTLVQGTE
jgi:hypothetical protein